MNTTIVLMVVVAAMTVAIVLLLLQNRRHNRRLARQEKLLCTDELTGAGSRRGLQKYLRRLQGMVGEHWRLYILLIDADSFKSINDRYGHAAGDAVLRKAAHRLMGIARTYGGHTLHDYLARLGGDEFVLVLACSDEAVAQACLAEVRSLLQDQVCRVGDKIIPFSFSVGVAPYTLDLPFAYALDQADKQMFASKPQGQGLRCVK